MSNLSPMRRMRILLGVTLAVGTLTVSISHGLKDPDLQTAVATALADEDPLIEVALERYPKHGPAIVATYGGLPLFQEQLARFGPQVVPIVAAYQKSFTIADALQLGQEVWQAVSGLPTSLYQRLWPPGAPAAGAPEIPAEDVGPIEERTVLETEVGASDHPSPQDRGLIAALRDRLASWFESAPWLGAPAADAPELTREQADHDQEQLAAENDAVPMDGLSEEERGLLALFNMDRQGNAFVGQWEITPNGKASRVPSRVVMLEGPELLVGGLTTLERSIFQEQKVDWQTYLEATVDVMALASGFTLLRFAKTAGHVRDAAKIPTPGPGRAVAKVLGIQAVRYGLPIGLVVLMVRHPDVFTQYLWRLAENLGLPGIIGPLVGWGIVIVPLAFLLSWMLLSVRALRFAGWLFAGAARGCRHLVVRLAMPERR